MFQNPAAEKMEPVYGAGACACVVGVRTRPIRSVEQCGLDIGTGTGGAGAAVAAPTKLLGSN